MTTIESEHRIMLDTATGATGLHEVFLNGNNEVYMWNVALEPEDYLEASYTDLYIKANRKPLLNYDTAQAI